MDWSQWFQNNALTVVTLVCLPILTFWLNRNKQQTESHKVRSESTSILIDSSGKLAESWEKLSQRLEREYNECRDTNQKLTERVLALESYNDSLNRVIKFLVMELEKTNPSITEKVREILNDIEVKQYPKSGPFTEENDDLENI